jgi:hypothetical protein
LGAVPGAAVRLRHARADRKAFVASLVHLTAVFAAVLSDSVVA